MLFSPMKLLAGATCLLGLTGFTTADDCENGPWTDVSSTGTGGGGSRYCATKWKDGIVITGVEIWASTKAVRAVQFYYSDGTNSDLFGKIDGDRHGRMDWDPALDGISQVKTWGDGRGQYLGRIQIRTKKGAELDVGKDTNGQATFETKVNSGIMLGVFGMSSDLIDNLGFLFLKSTIDKITIDDVVFDETPEQLNARMEGLETITLDYADHTNSNADANETFTFGRTEDRTVSKKWSNTATNAFGWSTATELSGKILDLGASSTTTLSYDYSKAKTEESSKETKVTLTYTVATMLKPGQRVYCRATAMTGTYKGDYKATVNVWLEDGFTFGFQKGGTMEQVNWSQASSECRDTPFPPTKRATKFIA